MPNKPALPYDEIEEFLDQLNEELDRLTPRYRARRRLRKPPRHMNVAWAPPLLLPDDDDD